MVLLHCYRLFSFRGPSFGSCIYVYYFKFGAHSNNHVQNRKEGFFFGCCNYWLFIAGIMLIGVFLVPRVISEINTNFSQSRVLTRELREEQGVFSKSRYPFIALKFKEIISRRITPQ